MQQRADGHRFGLVMFDGDDTLWAIQELYDRAKQRFASLLAQVPEPPETIVQELDEFDAARAKVAGYPRTRFRDSMLAIYHQLCERYRLAPSEAIQAAIARLGSDLFDLPPTLYPDTIQTLEQLRPYYRLVLVTKGDPAIQQARFVQTHMERFFDRPHIVPRKTAQLYRNLAGQYGEPPARCWVVGNSAVSDINPALEAGMRGVLVNRQTWLHEEGSLLPGDAVVVQSLSEAATVMLARDRALQQPAAAWAS